MKYHSPIIHFSDSNGTSSDTLKNQTNKKTREEEECDLHALYFNLTIHMNVVINAVNYMFHRLKFTVLHLILLVLWT